MFVIFLLKEKSVSEKNLKTDDIDIFLVYCLSVMYLNMTSNYALLPRVDQI